MKDVFHGSFTIERTYDAPPARVFAAWTDIETKARWFIGPPDKWTPVKRALDFRVGGRELLHGVLASGTSTVFTASYHAIVANERLVYAYDMHVGDAHLSVSLATVELARTSGGGTRMTFTEQAAFLDGEDGLASRDAGTAAHFDRLAAVLGDPHEIVSARVFATSRTDLFRAFSEPSELVRWWGPKGFTNTFTEFDLRAGGRWRFVMHAPDGTDHPIAKDFIDVVAPQRVVYRNLHATHGFQMTMTFVELGAETLLVWRMRFDSAEEATKVRPFIVGANEENFDRLAEHLNARRLPRDGSGA